MRKESYTFEEYNQEREAVIKESQYKEKYKNALKEIKEMMQAIMETNKVYPLQTNLDKILQKINEVLNA